MTVTTAGAQTRCEIMQQPRMWMDTLLRIEQASSRVSSNAVITGAGTSYYAAMAIEAAWPGSRAVPSTELLFDFERYLAPAGQLISLARSGDSPESAAVVEKIHAALPAANHLAITCNPAGRLANMPGVEALLLHPCTNDHSLVMTSSFSCLALAGILLGRAAEWKCKVAEACESVERLLCELEAGAKAVASEIRERVVFLAPPSMAGAAREASLKLLEMTAGRVVPLFESYLGLRHGPMSFLECDTAVVCFVSSDPSVRRYELDLITELRSKRLGRLIGVIPEDAPRDPFHTVLSTRACSLPDWLRTPFDIVFAQLLGLHLSLKHGFDPDNPSPDQVITRVVQGVRVYED